MKENPNKWEVTKMPLKIIRNDITKMNTQAIVNTANSHPAVGNGCDRAVYNAAGYDELLKYRKEHIGSAAEGTAFITPGFNLQAEYIIHAVSPRYIDGAHGEEKKLRACYRNSLMIAKMNSIKSVAFPLISTGSFGYPKEEGMRIAVEEINSFLIHDDIQIYLVVFDDRSAHIGKKLSINLEAYIDQNYVAEKQTMEYAPVRMAPQCTTSMASSVQKERQKTKKKSTTQNSAPVLEAPHVHKADRPLLSSNPWDGTTDFFASKHESRLEERIKHTTDTFSQYLMYLIQDKKMENAEVWKRAIIDKKVFSKIKNNPDYHPQKLTALCLCIGAKLNLDETKDLLARAGYALSPCDKTDIIFSYFIENEIYDMIELDIQLEEHGLPCIIS